MHAESLVVVSIEDLEPEDEESIGDGTSMLQVLSQVDGTGGSKCRLGEVQGCSSP